MANSFPARRHRPLRAAGRQRCARGLHPPHSVCRRARDHPAGHHGSDARPDDAGPALRPDDRLRLRAQAGVLLGRQSRRRLAASAARRGRTRLAAAARDRGAQPLGDGACLCRRRRRHAVARSSAAIVGSDLPSVNPNIKSIACPFTGEELAAVPAHRPDVTIIHAQKADRDGNVLDRRHHRRPEGSGARGPAQSIVTVEEDRRSTSRSTGTNAVDPAVVDRRRDRRRAGRRPAVVRARLLRARQRVLRRLGRHLARSRERFIAGWTMRSGAPMTRVPQAGRR